MIALATFRPIKVPRDLSGLMNWKEVNKGNLQP